jgi:hypothetical protein
MGEKNETGEPIELGQQGTKVRGVTFVTVTGSQGIFPASVVSDVSSCKHFADVTPATYTYMHANSNLRFLHEHTSTRAEALDVL